MYNARGVGLWHLNVSLTVAFLYTIDIFYYMQGNNIDRITSSLAG